MAVEKEHVGGIDRKERFFVGQSDCICGVSSPFFFLSSFLMFPAVLYLTTGWCQSLVFS